MINNIEEARNLLCSSSSESEKQIANMALEIVKSIHLDDECVLACLLYFPYIKTAIYVPPSEEEQKLFDETKRKQEEARKEQIEKQRLEFKEYISKTFGEDVLAFLHALKKLLEI